MPEPDPRAKSRNPNSPHLKNGFFLTPNPPRQAPQASSSRAMIWAKSVAQTMAQSKKKKQRLPESYTVAQ